MGCRGLSSRFFPRRMPRSLRQKISYSGYSAAASFRMRDMQIFIFKYRARACRCTPLSFPRFSVSLHPAPARSKRRGNCSPKFAALLARNYHPGSQIRICRSCLGDATNYGVNRGNERTYGAFPSRLLIPHCRTPREGHARQTAPPLRQKGETTLCRANGLTFSKAAGFSELFQSLPSTNLHGVERRPRCRSYGSHANGTSIRLNLAEHCFFRAELIVFHCVSNRKVLKLLSYSYA